MTSTAPPNSTPRQPELVGQTVVVIGGSAGIGLETARRAHAEGADVILTARNPDRLQQAALELGAQHTAAFDAIDFDRLERFFLELPGPIDHVLVTGPVPITASEGDRPRKGPPRRRSASVSATAGGSGRGEQGSTRWNPALHGRHRWPDQRCGLFAYLGAYGRAARPDQEPGAGAGTHSGESNRGGVCRHPVVGVRFWATSSTPAGSSSVTTLPVRRVIGPADIAALAVHLMTNTAVTGATYDIDGGQQLVTG